ncbi:MAG: 30S ribosomal protein S13 [bacterium]
MVRIAGVDLPSNKRLEIGLTYIYGIGRQLALEIIDRAKIDPGRKGKDLTEGEVVALREIFKDYPVEGDLRKNVHLSIKRLMDIGTYRGLRHKRGLPARGQRTRTNARTKRGKRKTVGAGHKKKEITKE